MKKIINIKPNNYPVWFKIYLNYTNKEIAANLKKTDFSTYTKKHICKEISEDDFVGKSAVCYTCSSLVVISIPEFVKNPANMAIMQHELLHGVLYSGKKVGFKLSEDSEEYYTYMLQFLTYRLYKTMGW